MFKLVVLFALVAVAVARPSVIAGHSALIAAPAYAALPSAVSHQFRSDILVGNPLISAHVAPAVVAAPAVIQKTVAVAAPVAIPAAVSHSYRTDVISKPVVAVHAAPAVVAAPVAYAHHVPSVHAW